MERKPYETNTDTGAAIYGTCKIPFAGYDYLADIEEEAQERFERIVEQMKQAHGITEQLKAENQMKWVGRMNNIQSCAREIVDKEIIYQ